MLTDFDSVKVGGDRIGLIVIGVEKTGSNGAGEFSDGIIDDGSR